MLMVGFTLPVAQYASLALFRELVQNEDGTLGLKWPAEMIPVSGSPISLKIQPLRGDVSGDALSLRLSAGEQNTMATCFSEKVPDNVRITLRIMPDPGASGFGICVRGQGDYTSGKELCFEVSQFVLLKESQVSTDGCRILLYGKSLGKQRKRFALFKEEMD